MSLTSIGDLAQSIQLRRDTARAAADVRTLAGELSSGRKADIGRALSGDTAPIAAIERDLAALASYDASAREAGLTVEVAEQVLGRIAEDADTLTSTLLLARTAGQVLLVDAAAGDARQRFAAAVSGLNTQIAGRSVFAGQALGTPALAAAESILGDLYTAVAAAPDTATALADIDAWFAPGGGFETTAYLGSPTRATPVRVGDGTEVQPTLLATDPRITDVLSALAKAAILDLGLFAGQGEERAEIAVAAAEGLLDAQVGLTDARAEIGLAGGDAEEARARIGAESSALELALSEIVSADPFETATRLRDAEDRLEALFVLTGRIADLSLTRYLR